MCLHGAGAPFRIKQPLICHCEGWAMLRIAMRNSLRRDQAEIASASPASLAPPRKDILKFIGGEAKCLNFRPKILPINDG